jgi:hypothetical protein
MRRPAVGFLVRRIFLLNGRIRKHEGRQCGRVCGSCLPSCFLKSPTAFVVNSSDVIEERTLKLGLTTPDKFEILAGLKENDLVMVGNRSQVKPGQKVDVKLMEAKSLP